MTSSPVKRKLAAILSADAFGYSRMMAADEEGTAKILAAHRAVIDGIIEFHEGRIVNTAGDSVLAEFHSPIEAVRCAVEIQDALKTRNDALPDAQRMQFRIGVNLGDVMVKGEDLLGDGVNVAARLQGIAEPGSITLSSSIYDQIAGKLDLGFIDLGNQSLKNIDRPIRAYRVERQGRRSPPSRAGKNAARAGWALGVAFAAAGAIGLGWWYLHELPAREEQARSEQRLAKQRAEAEEEKRKSKAEAELAKAREEAEQAKKRAEAEAGAAAQAKRALEEERLQEMKRRTQAELAAAEKARRAAELAEAAAKAAPPVAAATVPQAVAPSARARQEAAPSWPGVWVANFSCDPMPGAVANAWSAAVKITNDTFEVRYGAEGKPNSFSARGTPNANGRLALSGKGVSGAKGTAYGKPYPAAFDLKREGERFSGEGMMGKRACKLVLAPKK